ncbi:hypothetical protein L798_11653 [Zootermopsis nevadensis]|uniref:Uncharacterized protein n=1 Tax=Zootermopsis nevadensis TaxID=136037 RepID=A0A067QX06_ZOONE|nr:hypothetical protein L798_11653 [Zootermopsis nevadensis]
MSMPGGIRNGLISVMSVIFVPECGAESLDVGGSHEIVEKREAVIQNQLLKCHSNHKRQRK